MTNIIPCLIWDLSANFEALQAVTKDKKLVTGPSAGHPNAPRHFFPRFGLVAEIECQQQQRLEYRRNLQSMEDF
jgi:hypothetical protein